MSATRPRRPIAIRLLNAAGRIGERIGLPMARLDESKLLAEAQRRARLEDFGNESFRAGLGVLLASLEGEARLTALGRMMAKERVVSLLASRLRLVDWRKHHPEVAGQQIHSPWFVLGLPRTGTTLLYGLLAQDPEHRSPMSWEVAEPVPPPETATFDTDPRIEANQRQIDGLEKIAPGFQAIHPVGARLPQECISLTALEFKSHEFAISFDIPAYLDWLYNRQDMRSAYRFHSEMLQHLQSRHHRPRWVLKAPVHLFTLDALLERYPDARIIQTHRDPLDVMASVSSLHYVLRGAATDAVDPIAVGRQQVTLWSEMLRRGMAARDRRAAEADRFCDVQFNDLLADPIGCVRRVYAHFDTPLSSEAETRMRRYLAENPREKHGTHRYMLETFSIDPVRDGARFDAYCECYRIPRARR